MSECFTNKHDLIYARSTVTLAISATYSSSQLDNGNKLALCSNDRTGNA